MRLTKILIIYLKELLEVVRNTKTLFLMIFMPVLLFPVLFIGMGYFAGKQMEKNEKATSKIVIINSADAPELTNSIKNNKAFNVLQESKPALALEKKLIQMIIQIPTNFSKNIADEKADTIEVLYDQSNVTSIYAHKRFIEFFNDYKKEFYKDRLAQKGINVEFLEMLNIKSKNTASSQQMGAFVIGRLLPFIILVLAYSGAMYTALSITVGEKERQTIETLLVSAIKRQEIVLGKFLTVFTASGVSALLGLVSLFLTFKTSSGALSLDANTPISFSISSLLVMFSLILPVAGIFSAILLMLGSFARTNKEGEMYASLFFMAIIMLSAISIIPGFEPELKLFLVPVMNTTLIQKELLMSDYNFLHILFTLVSTTFFAFASLYTAAKLFLREEILFRS